MKIKSIVILAILLRGGIALVAQPMNASRPEFLLETARERYEEKDYYNALDLFEKYYDQTKDRSVAYETAMLHMNLRDYAKAETWFSRSLQKDKKNPESSVKPDARYNYALMMKMNGKYEECTLVFEEFIQESTDEAKKAMAKTEIEGAKMALKMRENIQLVTENAGNKINTANNEYSPSVSPDGNTLYFSGFRSKEIIKLDGKEGDYFLKIFKSARDAKGAWANPEPVSDNVNRVGNHQGSVYVSPDGKVMYFTRIGLDGNEVGESKLFYSMSQGDGWGPANEVKGINGKYIVKHPCIGELYGKEVLFFSSNMDGTTGGFDIYYANKLEDGSFGTPTNAGTVVNTAGDEETPFYRDGKLYFSSNGHPNIGGFDLFLTSWNGSSWTKPENLGLGYNSPANDRYPSVDEDGSVYFISNRPGSKSLKSRTCCEDVFIVKKAPIKIDLIVTATDGKAVLKGLNYQLFEVTGGKKSSPDEKAADTYTSDLTRNRAYLVIASKPGYYNDTVQFNTVGINQPTTIQKKMTLRPLPVVTASLRAVALIDGKQASGVTFQLTEVETKRADQRTTEMYTAGLGLKKSYVLIAGKAGYTPDSVRFNTNDITETTTIEKTLNLRPKVIIVKRQERIKVDNLYYKLDKSAATEDEMDNWELAQKSLDYLYDIMKKYPDMVIELSSHTDSRGSDSYNLELSQKRADGVKAYLMNKGIEKSRIVAKGYGETRLVNRCKNGVKCSDEEHLQNRRTEFRIISGPETIEITEQQSAAENK